MGQAVQVGQEDYLSGPQPHKLLDGSRQRSDGSTRSPGERSVLRLSVLAPGVRNPSLPLSPIPAPRFPVARFNVAVSAVARRRGGG